MSKLSLKDELAKLNSTAPKLKQSDDEYSDEETKARVQSITNEYEHELELNVSDNRRLRPTISDLDDYGARYKGKSVTRRQVRDENGESMSNEEDEVDGFDLEDEDMNEEDDDEEDDSAEDDSEEDDDDEYEEEEEEEEEDYDEEIGSSKASRKSSQDASDLKIMNFDRNEEIAKGKAVKNQLNFWDSLLDARVKLQSSVTIANQFPQQGSFSQVVENLDEKTKNNSLNILKENQTYIIKSINQLVELQQRLFALDTETSYMIDENKDSSASSNKRKRNDNSEDDTDNDMDDDEDDEEIYSDTDAENEANERKRQKKNGPIEINFKKLEPSQIESYLAKVHKQFQKYRNSTIQKWYDKTRLVTGKSFEAFEKPIMQQIEHLLMDKERIIRRTQIKRSIYEICAATTANKVEKLEDLHDRHVKDFDVEIFDDQDFYNQLLRELIDRKTSNVSDPVALSRKSIELQKLRSKTKKVVDTKASKGRKIKFDVHKLMINFMAPIYRSQWSDEARDELFKSLFKDHIHLNTSDKQVSDGASEVEFQSLFKSF